LAQGKEKRNDYFLGERMKIGNREFYTKDNLYIMGILNVTPDSFSDGGKWNSIDLALRHAERMIEEGADLLDIGGESTRPGYRMISGEEEIDRIVPVIEKIKANFDIPLSIDTYKPSVAAEALKAGGDLINDIWGLRYDPQMAKVIADYQVPCCLMHNRTEAVYEDYLPDILQDLKSSIAIAKRAGIEEDKIILDPGIGFGKTLEQNLTLMNSLELLKELGYPVLLGVSRKSMVGKTLGLTVEERLEGTLAANVIGVMKGCRFFRVHDVKANRRAVLMAKAILEA